MGFPARFLPAVLLLVACGKAGSFADVPTVAVPRAPATGSALSPQATAAPIPNPGRYRLAFSLRQEEQACSRGRVSSHAEGDYTLDLEADGLATLTLTSESSSAIISLDRSGPGQPIRSHEAHRTSETRMIQWEGQAQFQGGTLKLALHQARAECSNPNDCSAPPGASLSCSFAQVDAMTAVSEFEQGSATESVQVDALRCSGAPAPSGYDDAAFTTDLPLSGSEVLVLTYRSSSESPAQRTLSLKR